MAQGQASAPFLGIEVPPSEVEKALIKTWREAARDDAAKEQRKDGEVSARVKATLANVIIVEGDSPPAGMSLDELISELCLSFPSRFCIVRYRSANGDQPLKTGVSSRCVLARSGAHVCSEELYIGAGPASVKHVPNLVLSMLVPDTPVVVLMSCDPSEEREPAFHELLQSLRHLSDRIIFDSRHIKNYGKAAAELLSDTSTLVEKGSFGCSARNADSSVADLRDLTWHRMGRWRSLVTELFDGDRASAPTRINQLRIESDISVSDLSSGVVPINALLLAGWFAARLGWQIRSGKIEQGGALIEADSAAGLPIKIEISAQTGGKGIRRIHAIEMNFADDGGGGLSSARIERNLVGQTVEVSSTSNGQTAKRLAPFTSVTGVGALTHELMSGHCDLDYLASLHQSRRIWTLFAPEARDQKTSATSQNKEGV